MLMDVFTFILRIGILLSFSIFVFKWIEPKTQTHRIFRAALLAAGFLAILVVMKTFGA